MKLDEVMATLKRSASAQAKKTYLRHGSGPNVFGTPFAVINPLAKKIKVDHALAGQLWETGNGEARIVALLVADPAQLTKEQANAWAEHAHNRVYGHYLGPLVARSPHAAALMRAWMKSKKEMVGLCGFSILCGMLRDDPEGVSDAECEKVLADIEKRIHASPNWVKYAMNSTLIAIGGLKPSMKAKAIAVARRIGKVDVDHGDTECRTPDARTCIEKASKRRRC